MLAINLKSQEQEDKNVFSLAFHADIQTVTDAENKLQGRAPGTYVTFSMDKQNYCAAVGKDSQITVKLFRWDASGFWYNGAAGPFETELSLLDYLVNSQVAIPFCPN